MLSHIGGGGFSPPPSSPCPPLPLQDQISASRPKSEPRDPNPSLEAQIPASRPKSQPQGPNLSLEAQIPARALNHSLEDLMPALLHGCFKVVRSEQGHTSNWECIKSCTSTAVMKIEKLTSNQARTLKFGLEFSNIAKIKKKFCQQKIYILCTSYCSVCAKFFARPVRSINESNSNSISTCG